MGFKVHRSAFLSSLSATNMEPGTVLRNICQLLLIRKQILNNTNVLNDSDAENGEKTPQKCEIKEDKKAQSAETELSRPSLVPIQSILEPISGN